MSTLSIKRQFVHSTLRSTAAGLAFLLTLSVVPGGEAYESRPSLPLVEQVVRGAVILAAEHDSLVAVPEDEALRRFRRWIYDEVGNLPNHRIRAEFYARYPSPTDFGARAFKEFLMLDAGASVVGVDRFGIEAGPVEVRRAVLAGARGAALDGRARNRLFRGRDGTAVVDGRGNPVPFDPLVLNVGPAAGPHSDAHAWLSTPEGSSAADFGLFERRPWEVALPLVEGDSVASFAADHAQLYTDLAVLANLWGEAPALPYLYAGSALSFLASAGTPTHTLQLGTVAVHQEGGRGWWRRIRTLFGLLSRDEVPDEEGLQLVANYRLLGRALVEARTEAPRDAARAGAQGGARPPQPTGQRWAGALVRSLADASRRPGAESFDLLAALADREIAEAPVALLDTLPAGAVVGRFISRPEHSRTQARLDRFLQLHDEAAERATSVGRTWWRRFEREAHPAGEEALIRNRERVLTRFVARQLAYLSEAEVRRARYMMARGAEQD